MTHIRAPLITALLLLLTALIAAQSQTYAAVLSAQIAACLHTLIPSLFGCTALAVLLRTSGAGAWLGAKLLPLFRSMHLNAELTGIFLMSQIAGYPVGAMLLRQAAENGSIPKETAARLSCVCFGGGPAFLVGLTGAQLLGSAAAGWWIAAACFCANLILLTVFRPQETPVPDSTACTVRLTPAMLSGSVSAAMKSLAQICGTVLLFGILRTASAQTGLLRLLELGGASCGIRPQTVRALFAACTDITQLEQLFACGLPCRILLPLAAALLSFGGICVHWQCIALGCGIRPAKLLLIRLAAALLTALFLLPAARLIPLPETVSVFAQRVAVSETGSVIPSLLIFCTGFPFLLKKD